MGLTEMWITRDGGRVDYFRVGGRVSSAWRNEAGEAMVSRGTVSHLLLYSLLYVDEGGMEVRVDYADVWPIPAS